LKIKGIFCVFFSFVVADAMWAVRSPTVSQQEQHTIGLAYALTKADMLRMDASVLTVQLNIRYLLEKEGLPSINIIAEKMTYEGQTRFEDWTRLPLGCAINASSFAARALTQVAIHPEFLIAYSAIGVSSEVHVQDSSAFCAEGEELSFLELQMRCASVRQVLLGFYVLPERLGQPIEIEVNPEGGIAMRCQERVWNTGDARCKLITFGEKKRSKRGDPDEATEVAGSRNGNSVRQVIEK